MTRTLANQWDDPPHLDNRLLLVILLISFSMFCYKLSIFGNFILQNIEVDLYTETLKLALFWLQNGGRLIHRFDLYTGKYGIIRCHWWTWTEVMYKDGQTFCIGLFISLLHKIESYLTLYFLCCYAITWVIWKQMVLCIMPIVMRISILEACRFFVEFYRKNVVVITRWCNFHQQRSFLTQFY